MRLTFDPINPKFVTIDARDQDHFYVTIGGVIDKQETVEDSVING